MLNLSKLRPYELREIIRNNKYSEQTSGLAPGFAQGNLVILEKEYAYDFLLFCERNSKACPILDVTDTGSPSFERIAKNSDVRTDLPKYRIYRHGVLEREVSDIKTEWNDNMVAFMIGCSFTFEHALVRNGIPLKHMEQNTNVPMFNTNISCEKAGKFEGPMVVSMRPIPIEDVVRSVQITSRFPSVHGAPIHIGDPAIIGIEDITQPNFGTPTEVSENEVPVFWACGVTPQAVAMYVKPNIMITHSPGHMFITDIKEDSLAVL